MQTFYVTTIESETKISMDILSNQTTCACGISAGYIDEKNNCQIVVCDSCHENASNKERFF